PGDFSQQGRIGRYREINLLVVLAHQVQLTDKGVSDARVDTQRNGRRSCRGYRSAGSYRHRSRAAAGQHVLVIKAVRGVGGKLAIEGAVAKDVCGSGDLEDPVGIEVAGPARARGAKILPNIGGPRIVNEILDQVLHGAVRRRRAVGQL